MSDELVKRLRDHAHWGMTEEAADRIEALTAELAQHRALSAAACGKWAEVSQSNYRRAKAAEAQLAQRDAWRAKAEGYDAVRLALRKKVGTPWPPHMSRVLWAGIAADEKKRADDAEAALLAADEDVRVLLREIYSRDAYMSPELKAIHDRLAAYRARRATGGGT